MLYAITQESSLDSFFCKSPYDTTTPMILHSNKNAPELLCLEVYALELSGSLVSISVSVHCIGSMTLSVHFRVPSFLSEYYCSTVSISVSISSSVLVILGSLSSKFSLLDNVLFRFRGYRLSSELCIPCISCDPCIDCLCIVCISCIVCIPCTPGTS